MADIATRAGLSVGLAYHHFGNKDGLIAAVIEDFYDQYSQRANERIDAESWAERERLRSRKIIQFMIETPFTRIVLGPLGRQADAMAADANALARLIEIGAGNIAQGQRRGEVDDRLDPKLAASFVLGGLRQAVAAALAQKAPPDIERLSTQIWDQIAASLGIKS